jgi:hypothetical protein
VLFFLKKRFWNAVTQNLVREGVGGVTYTDARKKGYRMPSVFILLRKNFWNGILARSVTKIPLSKRFVKIKPIKDCSGQRNRSH